MSRRAIRIALTGFACAGLLAAAVPSRAAAAGPERAKAAAPAREPLGWLASLWATITQATAPVRPNAPHAPNAPDTSIGIDPNG